jgi:replication factor A1
MIRMPLPEVRKKIVEKTGLEEADVDRRIDQKLSQLSGLISKEGAAHIVANELGVKLFENSGKIKDIYPGMRNIDVNAKVMAVYEKREFNRSDGTQGKVGSAQIADDTGSIRLVGWGGQADIVAALAQGSVVGITSAYARENNRGYKELHLNDNAKLELNPDGVTVEAKELSSAGGGNREYTRKDISALVETDSNVEIMGTIVQVFDIRFFEVCPDCSKRAKGADGNYECPSHGPVTPDYSYVLNIFLEDGTERIRIVLFRDLIEKITAKNKEALVQFKDHPELFEEVKTALLGEQFKMQGRIKKNTFFDRIEFVPNNILPADPEEELKRLE